MKAVVFDTSQDAYEFSKQAALNVGCHGGTVYFYSVRKLVSGQFAVIVGDDVDNTEDLPDDAFLVADAE